jgi:hypothetical protein
MHQLKLVHFLQQVSVAACQLKHTIHASDMSAICYVYRSADKSLALPTFRCRRTESIVSMEIHAILTETLGEHAPSYATVKNWVVQFKRGDFFTFFWSW